MNEQEVIDNWSEIYLTVTDSTNELNKICLNFKRLDGSVTVIKMEMPNAKYLSKQLKKALKFLED